MAGTTCVLNQEKRLAAEVFEFFNRTPYKLITEKDLKTPTRQKIFNFYHVVLSEFCVDVSHVVQTRMKQVECLGGNIEISSDLILCLNLAEAVKCLQIPGFHDFNVMHILNPMPKSTFKYISHMMHFLSFADQHCIAIRKVPFRRVIDARKKREYLLEKRDNLKNGITQRGIQLKEEESRLSNIDSVIENKMSKLTELTNEKEKWHEKNEIVKAQLTKISEIRDKQSNETHMKENDLKEFQKRIKSLKNVHNTSSGSSQHLSLETLRMKASNLKEQKSALQQKLTTTQVELDFQLKFQHEYPFLKSKLKEVVELLVLARSIKNAKATSTQESSTTEDTVKSLVSYNSNLTSELDKSEENINT